jgi:hypothetical protein
MPVHNTGDGRFFYLADNGHYGIKVFPRCGSGTLRKIMGGTKGARQIPAKEHTFDRWLKTRQKVIVVRHPWDRLLSFWHGRMGPPIANTDARQHRLFGAFANLDDFLEQEVFWTPDEKRDWHWRSMYSLLQGYDPKPGEVYSLDWVVKSGLPGVGQVHIHEHQTTGKREKRPERLVSLQTYERWKEEYRNDFDLWEMARKP